MAEKDKMLSKKLTEWRLDEELKTRDDLVEFMKAAVEDIETPVSDLDFEYLLYLCQDVLNIAKKKGWG